MNMRAPGMTYMKMPLFVWTWLITAFLLIAVMPVLAGAVTMVLTDKYFGTSFFEEGGGPNFGWTFYAPLSTTYSPPSTGLFVFAIHIMGISSIMGAINVIVTIMNMRAPGMTYMKMPLFVWTWLITAFLLIANISFGFLVTQKSTS